MSGWGGTAKTCTACGHDTVHRDRFGRCPRCVRRGRFVGSEAAAGLLHHLVFSVVLTLTLAVIAVLIVRWVNA